MQLITRFADFAGIMVYISGHSFVRAGNPSKGSCCGGHFRLPVSKPRKKRTRVSRGGFMQHLYRLWRDDEGQDIAEYAVMLAVILVIVVGTIRLIGSNANNVFSNVASSIQ
jgi:Flp pilus assembly pilin Flp